MTTREYPSRPVVGVGAVVLVTDADRARIGVPASELRRGVVLIKRRFEPLAGQWSLPGGAVEVGETLDAAIAREVFEETCLVVDVGPPIEVFDRIMLDESARVRYHFVLIDYLCHVTGGRLRPGSDVSDAVIADPHALEPFALTDKARSVIARALAI
ncbi:MAG: NUDIX hydrolase [Vicinamibacterales bacterium]